MFAATGSSMSSYVLQVQRAVSEALLAVHEGTDDATLRVSLRKYPELMGAGASSGGGGQGGPPVVACTLRPAHHTPRCFCVRALASSSQQAVGMQLHTRTHVLIERPS